VQNPRSPELDINVPKIQFRYFTYGKKKLTKLSCCIHTSAKKLSTYSIPAFTGTFAITHGIADETPQKKRHV